MTTIPKGRRRPRPLIPAQPAGAREPSPGLDCGPACDHRFTYADDQFRLNPGTLACAMRLCRANLAGRLGLTPEDVATLNLNDERGRLTGFCLTLLPDSCFGYHRITYDVLRVWTYCSDPGRPPLDPSCAFPLTPHGPAFEVMRIAADCIISTARRRAELRAGHQHPGLLTSKVAGDTCLLPVTS